MLTFTYAVFTVDVLVDLEFDFQLEAMLHYEYKVTFSRTYDVTLAKNPATKDYEMMATCGPVSYGNEPGDQKHNLSLQGKMELSAGVRTALRFGFTGTTKWCYVGLDAGVGLYADLSGMLNVDFHNIGAANESYYAAFLEVGAYFDVNCMVHVERIYEKPGKNIVNVKVPIFRSGDNYAYYSYVNCEPEMVIGTNTTYDLSYFDEVFLVNRYDLSTMTSSTAYLDPAGDPGEYSVTYYFRDSSDNVVSYCYVDNGILYLTDHAPETFEITMGVIVTDDTIPNSLAHYFSQTLRLGGDSGAYHLGTLEVRLTRDPNMQGSEGLAYISNGDGTCYVSGIGTCVDTDVIIPSVSPEGDRVTSINDFAFYCCSCLTSVTIPYSVTSIGGGAFAGCGQLKGIWVDSNNYFYCNDEYGVLFNKEKTELLPVKWTVK